MITERLMQLERSKPKKTPWHTVFAEKAFFSLLSQCEEGQLHLEYADKIYTFGQDDAQPAELIIHDPYFFIRVASSGGIGFAESYILQEWTTASLEKVLGFLARNLTVMNRFDQKGSFLKQLFRVLQTMQLRNTIPQAARNIEYHYDLPVEFYALFLDKRLQYSSAYFNTVNTTLDAACEYKLQAIAQKLQLAPEMDVMEIGSGWGGLAHYFAQNYKVNVTTTTISQQQCQAANTLFAGYHGPANLLCLQQDYRHLKGAFDRGVSVEMIEAVGNRYLNDYFRVWQRLLKPEGLLCIQAITIPGQRFAQSLKETDFIQKYIFPGGFLPSLERIFQAANRNTDFITLHVEDIGLHYAKTLHAWRERFLANTDKVLALGFCEKFVRLWEYYLCYCQIGFEERLLQNHQIIFAGPRY